MVWGKNKHKWTYKPVYHPESQFDMWKEHGQDSETSCFTLCWSFQPYVPLNGWQLSMPQSSFCGSVGFGAGYRAYVRNIIELKIMYAFSDNSKSRESSCGDIGKITLEYTGVTCGLHAEPMLSYFSCSERPHALLILHEISKTQFV
ncbi:hypothetical protein AVEN_152994-1 [Araneus ventricosus]|uniref:Uncharacterized protein n=1 Tax=Araneus ventricosus TaxID=182803 RepID=A0A4Y2AFR7_ARAVE|nr:hypothetical protein AVEN_152994-1 [Araneus ventricosus]